jgi:kinesin family protein C1
MNRVKVACRVRPALDVHTGEALGEEPAVEVLSSSNGGERKSLRFEDGLTFTIDHVYDQKSNQEQVFDGVAKPLVEEAFRGFNCTLFSYGQTGSGKTYTLQGKGGESRGIVPRTVEEIFKHTARLENKKGTEEECIVEMHLSVMEIYQERLKDLLSTQNSGIGGAWGQAGGSLAGTTNLRIREHTGGSVWVEGLTEVLVTGEEQFVRIQ